MLVQAIGLFAGAPLIFLTGWTLSVPVLVAALAGFGLFKGFYDANIWAALYDFVPRRAGPPRSDDDADSPHFPLPPLRIMTEQSHLADAYGLDVWIWYPAMDRDYSDPATIKFALTEWGEVFRALPRIDAVLVPSGDPGDTRQRVLLPFLEKQAANLRRYHPKAQMWVSGQGFNREQLEEFFTMLRQGQGWLAGVVYGPQIRVSLADFRKAVSRRFPDRNYTLRG